MVLVTSFMVFRYLLVLFCAQKFVPCGFFQRHLLLESCSTGFFGSLVENCYRWAEVCFSWEVWSLDNLDARAHDPVTRSHFIVHRLNYTV